MNSDEIVRMVQEAYDRGQSDLMEACKEAAVQAIAVAVAEEREACAKVCDSLNFVDNGTPAGTRASNRHCAAAIRARGQA